MNGNKFATGQILRKPEDVVIEGADFSWLSSKVSRTLEHWRRIIELPYIYIHIDIRSGAAAEEELLK
jgi:hypothetical protein